MKLKQSVFHNGVVLALSLATLQVWAQTYQEVAYQRQVREKHSSPFFFSSGVSCADFNRDGLDDITLASQYNDSLWFYRNTGNGFVKIAAPVSNTDFTHQIIWVDYDNDGDRDLYFSSLDQINRLYRNDSSAGFTDVTISSGLSSVNRHSFGASWGDVNNDGWLDLYQCNRGGENFIYFSDQAGGFTNQAGVSRLVSHDRLAFASVFFDMNNDGFQDIFIANDKTNTSELYKNNGDSTFTEISQSAGVDVNIDAMCATVGDYNDDGFLDLYITNTQNGNKLFRNNGNETFTQLADSMGVAFHSLTWASNFLDYDNDGDLDLYVSETHLGLPMASESPLFRNTGSGFVEDTIAGLEIDMSASYSHALGDFNSDGHFDIVSPNKSPDSLELWESTAGSNNWIKISLQGVVSNREGIGSWIKAYAGGQTYRRYTTCGSGYLTQNSFTEIIGLGTNTVVDSLEINWLSGHTDKLYQLPAQNLYHVIEGSTMIAQLSLEGDTTFCAQDSFNINLELSDSYSNYLWSNGDTSSGISVSSPGTYYAAVTNSFGLTDTTNEFKVIVDSFAITATIIHDSLNQGRGKIEIFTSGGIPPFQFTWSKPGSPNDSVLTNLQQGNYSVVARDSIGCQDSVEVTVLNPLSEVEFQWSDFAVFPNPAEDLLHLRGPVQRPLNFSLGDPSGQIFRKGVLKMPASLRINNLSPGLYILKFWNEEYRQKSLRFFKN